MRLFFLEKLKFHTHKNIWLHSFTNYYKASIKMSSAAFFSQQIAIFHKLSSYITHLIQLSLIFLKFLSHLQHLVIYVH